MAEVANKNETGKQATTANVTIEPPPPGDYKLVAVGLDFTGTGEALADEILKIGAFTINDNAPTSYGQYILPTRNIGNASQRAHGVRVGVANTFSEDRFLYEIIEEWPGWAGKVINTMSEYDALNAFMEWLVTVKGDSKGIILIHHGNKIDNLMPQLLQALDRYTMTDAFYGIIHGCVNLRTIGTDHPQMNGHPMTMISFLKRVLNFGNKEIERTSLRCAQCAGHRAELTYKIAMKIFNLPDETEVSTGALAYCFTKDQEREIIVAKQNKAKIFRSLSPIFINRMRRGTYKTRRQTTLLRRYLIDLGIDYDTLNAAYTRAGKDEIIKLVVIDDPRATPMDLKDLVDVLFAHFEKKKRPRDVNAHKIERGQGEQAEKGEGEPRPRLDEDDDDEEFEEAQGEK